MPISSYVYHIQGGSNMTRTVYTCLHTNQSRSYLNHLVYSRLAHVRIRHFECLAVCCDCFHNLQNGIFWEVLLCNQAGICPHFRGLCCHAFDMGAADSSEMSVNLYVTLWYNITEDSVINRHACYIVVQFCATFHLIFDPQYQVKSLIKHSVFSHL